MRDVTSIKQLSLRLSSCDILSTSKLQSLQNTRCEENVYFKDCQKITLCVRAYDVSRALRIFQLVYANDATDTASALNEIPGKSKAQLVVAPIHFGSMTAMDNL